MKKCISILAIIIMLISLNVNISLGANITEAYLYSKGGVKDLLMYNGIEVYTTIVVYSNDGVEYPAYCVNKDLKLPYLELADCVWVLMVQESQHW